MLTKMIVANKYLVLAVFCVQLMMANEPVVVESVVQLEDVQKKWAFVKTILPDKAVLDVKTAWLDKVLYPGLITALLGGITIDALIFNCGMWRTLINGRFRNGNNVIDGKNVIDLHCSVEPLIGIFLSILMVSCIMNIFNNLPLFDNLPLFGNYRLRQLAITFSAQTLLCASADCLPESVVALINEYKKSGSSDREALVRNVSAIAWSH